MTAINPNSPVWAELFACIAERGEMVPPVLLSIYRGDGGTASTTTTQLKATASTRRNRASTRKPRTKATSKAATSKVEAAKKMTTNEKAAALSSLLLTGPKTMDQIVEETGIQSRDATRILKGQLSGRATLTGDLWSLTAQGQQRLAA